MASRHDALWPRMKPSPAGKARARAVLGPMSRRGARPAQATRPRRRWHVNFFVGASYNPEDVLPWAGELAFADSLCALVKKAPAVVAGREPAFAASAR